MDERLEKALDFANYMTTLNNQKRVAKEKFYENNVHYFNGGQFSVTKELLNFCNMLVQSGQENVVLIDDNDIPVRIDNIDDFYQDALNIYFTSTNEYHTEYENIRSKRKVSGLVDHE